MQFTCSPLNMPKPSESPCNFRVPAGVDARAFQEARDELSSHLQRGMRTEMAGKMARYVLDEPAHMHALLCILESPADAMPIQVQKAAWVLHRAFQLDQRGLIHHRTALSRVLDSTDDPSALREILKILANPIWIDLESNKARTALLHLAMDLLYVAELPVAVHYAALQIIQTRALSTAEEKAALASIQSLIQELNQVHNQDPSHLTGLYKCVMTQESELRRRLTQKRALTKSPS